MVGVSRGLRQRNAGIKVVACCPAAGQAVPGPREQSQLRDVSFAWQGVANACMEMNTEESFAASVKLLRRGILGRPVRRHKLRRAPGALFAAGERERLEAGTAGAGARQRSVCSIPVLRFSLTARRRVLHRRWAKSTSPRLIQFLPFRRFLKRVNLRSPFPREEGTVLQLKRIRSPRYLRSIREASNCAAHDWIYTGGQKRALACRA